MKRPDPYTVVRVVWKDAGGSGGWQDYAPSKTMECVTYAMVVKWKKDRLAVSPTMSLEKGWCRWHDILEIPIECIVDVQTIAKEEQPA